jgi:hypothetical protein
MFRIAFRVNEIKIKKRRIFLKMSPDPHPGPCQPENGQNVVVDNTVESKKIQRLSITKHCLYPFF